MHRVSELGLLGLGAQSEGLDSQAGAPSSAPLGLCRERRVVKECLVWTLWALVLVGEGKGMWPR